MPPWLKDLKPGDVSDTRKCGFPPPTKFRLRKRNMGSGDRQGLAAFMALPPRGGPGVNEGRDGGGALPALPLLPDPAVLGPLATFLTAIWPLDIPHLSFLSLRFSAP